MATFKYATLEGRDFMFEVTKYGNVSQVYERGIGSEYYTINHESLTHQFYQGLPWSFIQLSMRVERAIQEEFFHRDDDEYASYWG
jgi:hypothetical protein